MTSDTRGIVCDHCWCYNLHEECGTFELWFPLCIYCGKCTEVFEMNEFIGIKRVRALAMTRQEYNDLRGWTLPDDEVGTDQGFLVEYLDGGKANVAGFEGYVSWSPREVFLNAYRPIGGMSFGDALVALESGKRVARFGWNGKGMFLFLVNGSTFTVNRPPLLGIYPEGTTIEYCPHIDMRTADGKIVPWLCSQTDMLAKDWCIINSTN